MDKLTMTLKDFNSLTDIKNQWMQYVIEHGGHPDDSKSVVGNPEILQLTTVQCENLLDMLQKKEFYGDAPYKGIASWNGIKLQIHG